jgi:hypothetical protein
MISPNKVPTERALAQLLDALATVLIPLEITPARLAQIARSSFVKAGARHARMRSSGRPHLAKIAALTGLTRAEVKRIVAANYRVVEATSDLAPRALRVLNGWMSSKEFSARGRPRILSIAGTSPSFDELCKKFSGDIPRRVILDELFRSGRIAFTSGRRKVSITPALLKQPTTRREQSALGFAAALLTDALSPEMVVIKRVRKISASREFADAYIERSIAERLSELLDEMPKLYVGKSRPNRHILNAYTLVARTRPEKKKKAGA